MALARILASPQFIYRIEEEPANVAAGPDVSHQRHRSGVAAVVLPVEQPAGRRAARRRARRDGSSDPAVLEQQVRRMLADPKAKALAVNFAGQWLNLRGLDSVGAACRCCIPTSTTRCGRRCAARSSCCSTASFARIAPITELLTADYTFVNERLARHYGIPNVYGSQFRRVDARPGHGRAPRAARQGRVPDDDVEARIARRRSRAASGS